MSLLELLIAAEKENYGILRIYLSLVGCQLNASFLIKPVYPYNKTTKPRIQVFLRDSKSGEDLTPIAFEMKGDSIIKKTKKDQIELVVKIKVSMFEHVEGDPDNDCKYYSENFTYGQCVEEELVKTFTDLLGCHPPFISMSQGYCKNSFNMTVEDETAKKVSKILADIIVDFKPRTCLPPCTKYIYETKRLFEVKWTEKEGGICLMFSKKIAFTKTSFLIGVPSFLTGFGGAVSGGRTLMWIIVSGLSLLKYLRK